MKIRILILVLLCLHSGTGLFAQAREAINLRDAKGRPDGLWYTTQEARMGESAYTEFGAYLHGRKTGTWYRLDAEYRPLAMEQFRNDVLDGEVKYFEAGVLACVGHYRGLNPDREYDTIIVTSPLTGLEKLVPVRTDRGALRHGLWRFYDPMNGRLIREEEYQIDELVDQKSFGLTKEDSLYYQKQIRSLPHMKKSSTRSKRTLNSNIGY